MIIVRRKKINKESDKKIIDLKKINILFDTGTPT